MIKELLRIALRPTMTLVNYTAVVGYLVVGVAGFVAPGRLPWYAIWIVIAGQFLGALLVAIISLVAARRAARAMVPTLTAATAGALANVHAILAHVLWTIKKVDAHAEQIYDLLEGLPERLTGQSGETADSPDGLQGLGERNEDARQRLGEAHHALDHAATALARLEVNGLALSEEDEAWTLRPEPPLMPFEPVARRATVAADIEAVRPALIALAEACDLAIARMSRASLGKSRDSNRLSAIDHLDAARTRFREAAQTVSALADALSQHVNGTASS